MIRKIYINKYHNMVPNTVSHLKSLIGKIYFNNKILI